MKNASTGWSSSDRKKLRLRPSRGYVTVAGPKGKPIVKRAPFKEWQERRAIARQVTSVMGYQAKHERIMDDQGTHRNIGCLPQVIGAFPELSYADAPWVGRARAAVLAEMHI